MIPMIIRTTYVLYMKKKTIKHCTTIYVIDIGARRLALTYFKTKTKKAKTTILHALLGIYK